MNETLIIRGYYTSRTFVPEGQLPDTEGTAELVIAQADPNPKPVGSIADAFGTATILRSGTEILNQLHTDREDWGDR